MPKRQRTLYDPLGCIPSVTVIEERLRESEEEARRLRVLLRTARAIAKGEACSTSKQVEVSPC
jgi:hypothetical protein